MFCYGVFMLPPKNPTSFKTNLNKNKNLKLVIICQEQEEPSEKIIR